MSYEGKVTKPKSYCLKFLYIECRLRMTVKCRFEKGRKLNYILQQLFWLKPKITHDYTHACIANHPTFRTAFAYLVRSKKIPRMNFMKIYYKRVKNVLPSSYYFGLLTASNYFHSTSTFISTSKSNAVWCVLKNINIETKQ